MLPSPSGSNVHRHSHAVRILDVSSVGEARRLAATLCEKLNFDSTQKGRVAIIVNELGNNLTRYGREGRLIFTVTGFLPDGFDMVSIDSGPGLDVSEVMQDGFTTGSTPGTGMGAILRQSDRFDIYSQPEKGTVVFARVLKNAEQVQQFETAVIGIPLRGESVSGDGWAVVEQGDALKVIMVDGLGHGQYANLAAKEALDAFAFSLGNAMDAAVQIIHGRLKSTRGAAIFLLTIKGTLFEFSGIGNIRAFWKNATKTKTLLSHNGTAGVQMRRAQILHEKWDQSGYIVLHSDGLLSRYNFADYPGLLTRHPGVVAAVLMRDFSRGTDDATVFVARRTP